MVSAIIFINCLIITLAWFGCLVIVTPAFNHFVQYGAGVLPQLTKTLVDFRFFFGLVPVLWVITGFLLNRKLSDRSLKDAMPPLLLFSVLTLAAGLLMLVVFGLAGILPYLKIGVAVE